MLDEYVSTDDRKSHVLALNTESILRGLATTSSGAGHVTEVMARAENPFSSTFPSEIVTCAFDDGSLRRVFIKQYMPGLHDGQGYWDGDVYESQIYRRVLASAALGTPTFYGSWEDEATASTFVAIEFVEAPRLNKAITSRMVDASHWLARLHREATPIAISCGDVRAYDEEYFRGWSGRALEFLRLARPGCAWIEPLIRRYEETMLPALLGSDRVFIHGELYPENVLVAADRICAVDWQSASIGPGEIDLASLTEGPWPPEVVQACRDEYLRTRWQGAAPSIADDALQAARLYWPIRWLGTSQKATSSARRAGYIDLLHDAARNYGLA